MTRVGPVKGTLAEEYRHLRDLTGAPVAEAQGRPFTPLRELLER